MKMSEQIRLCFRCVFRLIHYMVKNGLQQKQQNNDEEEAVI